MDPSLARHAARLESYLHHLYPPQHRPPPPPTDPQNCDHERRGREPVCTSDWKGETQLTCTAAGGGQDKAIPRTDDSKPPHRRAMHGATKPRTATNLLVQGRTHQFLRPKRSMSPCASSMRLRLGII